MGWQDEDQHGGFHEGYFIGLAETERGSGLFDELTLRKDSSVHDPIPLQWVCVGCDCGWRSPRLFAPSGTDWTPCHVWLAHTQSHEVQEAYEETGRKMWRRHVADINAHGKPVLRMDQDELRAAVQRRMSGPVPRRTAECEHKPTGGSLPTVSSRGLAANTDRHGGGSGDPP